MQYNNSHITGIAASLIYEKTLHVIGHIAVDAKGNADLSDNIKQKLQEFWKEITYLIIDEYSMISKTFLARLSRRISVGKETSNGLMTDRSFGGVNVILAGDFHQFPPVACGARQALYHPVNRAYNTEDQKIGRIVMNRHIFTFSHLIISY